MGEAVLTSFFQAGESKVELLVPTSPDSAIARHLRTRGAGLAPRRFSCRRPRSRTRNASLQRAIVWSPAPSQGADGKRIAFLHPSDTAKVLVELCADA